MMKWLGEHILEVAAGTVLALFAGVWGWIAVELLLFDATPKEPTLSLDEVQLLFAGFFASAVGAGTASVLGFEIQNIPRDNQPNPTTIAGRINEAARTSSLLTTGVLVYLLVGIFVAGVFFFRSDVAPDMVDTFAMGVLGWLGGAFSAVFRAKSD